MAQAGQFLRVVTGGAVGALVYGPFGAAIGAGIAVTAIGEKIGAFVESKLASKGGGQTSGLLGGFGGTRYRKGRRR